ncbi:MAG: response regulator transcription factor [Bacteroidota bacterium]|nr:response regulator transcription factor [Bacteroidota bacterium]
MHLLIIEDEENAIERLEKIIAEIAPDKRIVGKCTSIEQTLQWLKEHPRPDLILSDVQLSDGLSFEIFQQLDAQIPVIFVSAYDQFAVEAFKVHGLHYLLKPVKKNELTETMARYDLNQSRINATTEPAAAGTPEKTYQERFILHVGSQMKLIHDHEIAFIYTENKVVFIVTFTGQKYLMDMTLEALEKVLKPAVFFRINRQCIIALKSIVKMSPASKQRISLRLQPPAPFETITSFERTPQFRKWLLGEI